MESSRFKNIIQERTNSPRSNNICIGSLVNQCVVNKLVNKLSARKALNKCYFPIEPLTTSHLTK